VKWFRRPFGAAVFLRLNFGAQTGLGA